jgi:hypothetical protein
MDLTFSERELAFRDAVRTWLEDNHPGDEPEATRTPASRGGATSSAGWRTPGTPRCTGRRSTAAAARR